MVARHRSLTILALALAATVGTATVASADVTRGQGELSKKEFIKAADDICRQADELLLDIALSIAPEGPTNDQDLEEFVTQLIPIYEQVHDNIEALPEPAEDRTKIKKLLKTFSKELAAIEDDPTLIQRQVGGFPKASKLAKKYGLKVCGGD